MKISRVMRFARSKRRFSRLILPLLISFAIAGALFIHRERSAEARIFTEVAIDAAPDSDPDSKRLVVHGPFKYPPDDNASSGQGADTRLRRQDDRNGRGGGSDDYENRTPGPECRVPAKCAGRPASRLNGPAGSPKAFTNWKLDDRIGVGDPQIAAGRDCLLVSQYSRIAYLAKLTGGFLRVKSPPASGTGTGQGNRTTGPSSPIGLVNLTAPIDTNDLFAPMLDDINANLNLSAKEEAACNHAQFDCHINNFYDTRIIYDEYRDRFWVVSLAIAYDIQAESTAVQAARRGKLAVAVSITSDPRDGWNLYWWDSIPNDGHWPASESAMTHGADYPSVGVSPKYLLEEHSAGVAGQGNSTISIVEADPLARGEKPNSSLKAFQFWNLKDAQGAIVSSIVQPAVHHGSLPRQFDAVFASTQSFGGQPSLALWLFHDVQGKLSRTDVPISEFFGPRDAPQPSTTSLEHPFKFQMTNTGNSVMKAAYEHGRVYVTFHDCRTFFPGWPGCVTSVRLVKVRIGNPNVVEFDDSVGDRFPDEPDSIGQVFAGTPAVEVNRNDDVALVYMRSGEHVFPEVAYSLFFGGARDISPGRTLQKGSGADHWQRDACEQAKPACNPSQPNSDACKTKDKECGKPERDLDVGGISVDPTDDSFWIMHGYADGGGLRVAVGQIFGRVAAKPVKK